MLDNYSFHLDIIFNKFKDSFGDIYITRFEKFLNDIEEDDVKEKIKRKIAILLYIERFNQMIQKELFDKQAMYKNNTR